MEVLKPFRVGIIADILKNYNYEQPFHIYFSQLCRQHRQWGSKDRKIYKSVSYAYFRMGELAQQLDLKEAILSAYELTQGRGMAISPEEIFTHKEWLSHRVDFKLWALGLTQKRPLYLVGHRNRIPELLAYLQEKQIEYKEAGPFAYQLEADSPCNDLVKAGLAWVMDMASQRAADLIEINADDRVWDACSGAGGKSLYIRNKHDFNFELTCSDKRLSSLENLKTRFKDLRFEYPRIELSDLTDGFQLAHKYDKIILDVPCSGSGTWGRSPEQIQRFKKEELEYLVKLQRKIFEAVIKHLEPKGKLYYMTCSVFEAENEENAAYFRENYALELEKQMYTNLDPASEDFLYLAVLSRR